MLPEVRKVQERKLDAEEAVVDNKDGVVVYEGHERAHGIVDEAVFWEWVGECA